MAASISLRGGPAFFWLDAQSAADALISSQIKLWAASAVAGVAVGWQVVKFLQPLLKSLFSEFTTANKEERRSTKTIVADAERTTLNNSAQIAELRLELTKRMDEAKSELSRRLDDQTSITNDQFQSMSEALNGLHNAVMRLQNTLLEKR